jgi:hypothetical protein
MEEDLQPNLGAGPAGSTVKLLPRKPWHRGHERGVITTARAAPVNLHIIGSKRQTGNTSNRKNPARNKRRKIAACVAADDHNDDTSIDDTHHVYRPLIADEEYWGKEYELDEVVGKAGVAQPVHYMQVEE